MPLILTCYLLYWTVWSLESVLEGLVGLFLPADQYIPGMGLVLLLLLIMAAGVLVRMWGVRQLVQWGESLLTRVPLVKSVFTVAKDFVSFLSGPNKESRASRVVLVNITAEISLIGLVISNQIPDALSDRSDLLAVYLPMSYQLGGYTLYLPRDNVVDTDLTVEDAMRLILTGGVSSG